MFGSCQIKVGAAALLLLLSDHTASAKQPTVSLAVEGAVVEGTPLAWSDSKVLLLKRDGFLQELVPRNVSDFRKISDTFRPLSQSEMRGQLQREFGSRCEVSGTGAYLVVHPVGQRDRWARRFEDLYRSFVSYFHVRSMDLARPDFPLVAIVFHSQPEFLQYAQRDGAAVNPAVLGFYCPRSNRVVLYDRTHGTGSDADWHVNAETIIHEATHQTAFNTLVHSRTAPPPRWAAEGLAMLFEARGVWNPHHFQDLPHRINGPRLETFRSYARTRPNDSLASFIGSSDRLFASAPSQAYAEAWAFTFFLSEKEPVKYVKYLARTAQREPLRQHTPAEQLAEFTDIFGRDLKMLETRYLRFVNGLP